MARKTGEIIWLALQYAKQYRASLSGAYRDDTREQVVRDCLADIAAFEKLQIKLFGTTRSERQAMMDRMTLKSLPKIFREMDKSEEPGK